MNESERSELEWLKQRHAKLEQDLSMLAKQLKLIEAKLSTAPPTSAPVTPPPIVPVDKTAEAPPPATPPTATKPGPDRPFSESRVPPIIQPSSQAQPVPQIQPAPPSATPSVAAPSASAPPPVAAALPPLPKPGSFEMRLGTYWLVRIGIVMLLTGLVFFGNYAYEHYIWRLGPVGKVVLLYIASGILLGAGAWWQRKAATPALRNYAQVLFAGGLAAVYFTTFAAHYSEPLRVIQSRLVDGALLLAWAGFIVWIADRKKSEVLALFAVGLAYYTSVITRVGHFTLYSNLLLTVAAVFFLVRNRWAALSFASLVATYAAYAFWRFFKNEGWRWVSPEEGLWFGTYFLISYWVVFSAAVFLSKDDKFAGVNRATFATMNNGAFFVMFLLTMLQVRHGGFWKFSLIYGSVLLVCAETARRFLSKEPLAKNAYLTQGLLLVTVGLVAKYAGLQLGLLLAAESVVLLTLGCTRKSLVMQLGAYIAGAMAIGFAIDGLERDNSRTLLLAACVGAMMAFNAFWSNRCTSHDKDSWLKPLPAYFTLLALIIWLVTTAYNTTKANFPLALGIEAVALTLSIYLLRVREFAVFGQGYLVLAQCAWLAYFTQPNVVSPPWWNPALLIAITLAMSHWWQHQKIIPGGQQLGWFWQGTYALAIVGVLYFWLAPDANASWRAQVPWLALSSLLAVVITAYGVATRAWFLAVCAQVFLLISAAQFAIQLSGDHEPVWYFPLAPIAALALLSIATVTWFKRRPGNGENVREPLLMLATLYRWVAWTMSLWWVCEYVPARERTWMLASLGLALFLLAGWRRNAEVAIFSAAFTVAGFAMFWLPLHGAPTVYWPNFFAILILLGQQQAARRLPDRFKIESQLQGGMILLGGLSLWLLLYRYLSETASSFYMTAMWAALALVLFGCGIALRERVYRWIGLAVLACALGRVVLYDVWRLDTLYRILSFMALGIVLLVLGFIYNKYQEKIKEWL